MKTEIQSKQSYRFRKSIPGIEDTDNSPIELVHAYHQRSKHSTEGYAAGPESLDWDSQPSPYRSYINCKTHPLHFSKPQLPYSALFNNSIEIAEINLMTVSQLFEYALSSAAVKVFDVDSWTVRCNPSSGNLHPTEAYLICGELDQLSAGIYHYQVQHHQLEQRATFRESPLTTGSAYIALTSIHWREAWKYGERAYRYCQLDVGHAIASLRYSAAMLGWKITIEQQVDDNQISTICGIDRDNDFDGVEHESPDLLLRIEQSPTLNHQIITAISHQAEWYGLPNLLDSHPFYDWKIIEQISKACKRHQHQPETSQYKYLSHFPGAELDVANLIKQRRSALAFQPEKQMSQIDLMKILQALLPEQRHIPFDLIPESARIHPVLFIHRVEGLSPGLYALPRNREAKDRLQAAMDSRFAWQKVNNSLPLYLLEKGDAQAISKRICCYQDIAADSAFSLGMLAEYGSTLIDDENAWRYRQLHWEAGVLGQVLYLEAEANGYKGTGIGCFLDDLFHQLLGLEESQFQSLYHFTIGTAVIDERITTLAPY